MKKGNRKEKYDFSFCMKQNCRSCKHSRVCDEHEHDQVTRNSNHNDAYSSRSSGNKKKVRE